MAIFNFENISGIFMMASKYNKNVQSKGCLICGFWIRCCLKYLIFAASTMRQKLLVCPCDLSTSPSNARRPLTNAGASLFVNWSKIYSCKPISGQKIQSKVSK
jgi:hypothetical protein